MKLIEHMPVHTLHYLFHNS